MMACQSGYTAVVKLLLTAGADMSPTNCDGETALVVACRNGQTDIVKILQNEQALGTI